jgi:signal transduction histidine kinase
LQQRDGAICLEVSDDGSGFIANKVNKLGLGLHHIDARARKLGGRASVSSTPNQGTRIVVEFGKA